MRKQLHFLLLCTVLLMAACLPALAQYTLNGEDILANWTVTQNWAGSKDLTHYDSLVPRGTGTDPYAYGGAGLLISDNRGLKDPLDVAPPHDGHIPDDARLYIKNTFPNGTTGTATAVVRLKCTSDVAFNSGLPRPRNIMMVFGTGTKKCVGFGVTPDSAYITNNNGTAVYCTIPGDNTHFVTWKIVARNYGVNCDIYRNGTLVAPNVAINGTTGSGAESPIAGADALVVGSGGYMAAGGSISVTGSWLFDRVAYQAGEQPTWEPWGTPTQQISGVISDANNPTTRVADAKVTLSNGAQVTADAAGVYTFIELEPEEYTVTVSAEGYFSKTVRVALPQSLPSAVRNISLVPIPAPTQTVVDTFNRGELGSTESPVYPWIDTDEAGNAMVDWNAQLFMMPLFAHGISIGGGFLPSNIDYTIDLGPITSDSEAGFWGGIAYRQGIPCNFDNFGGQATADSGYLVWAPAGGAGIYLWRMGVAVGYYPGKIEWSVAHKLRVVAYGNVHQVYLDGVKVIEAADSGKLAGGYCGVFRDRTTLWADNLNIKQLPDAAGFGTISGNVYNAANPATKVVNGYVQSSDGRTVTTDANGNFSLSTNSLSEQSITVKAAGYADKTVWLEPGLGTTTANVAMDADPGYRQTIAGAKAAGANVPVSLSDKIITAQWGGTTMYVEEPDRSAGIKVTLPLDSALNTKTGKYVWLTGTMRQDSATGEFYVEATSKYEPVVARKYVTALAMNGRSVLGADGISAMGLDAKVVGKVTAVNGTSDFTINDGAGDLKVVINPAVGLNPWPVVNDYVQVEGIVSLDGTTPETAVRCIKPWNTNANILSNSSFEGANSIAGWAWEVGGGVGANIVAVTDVVHSGTQALKFTNTTGLAPNVYGTFYCIPGAVYAQEYELTYWVKADGVSEGNHWTDWTSWAFNVPAGTYDWTKISHQYRYMGYYDGNQAAEVLRLNITNYITGGLWLDDVEWRLARGTVKVIQPATP